MASGILNRMVRLFKARAHDALDKIEDPGSTAHQLVRELSAEIAKTEQACTEVLAEQKVIQGKREAEQKAADDWNAKAEEAVRAVRDDLAKSALERAARAERNVSTYDQSLLIISPRADALKAKLAELRARLDDADNEATMLDMRARVAKASTRATEILGDIGGNGINFEDLRGRVDRMEARAVAVDELAAEKSGANIDQELKALGATTVEDRLAALKDRVKVAAHNQA